MRNIFLFIALILLNINVFAQYDSNKTLTGFWGIKFGSSYDEVKSLMNQKQGCVYSAESSTKSLIYSGGKFAGEKIDFLSLSFHNGRFYKAICILNPFSELNIFTTYEAIKQDMSNKYFDPNNEIEEYIYPYKKGDGHEFTAIRTDKAAFGSIWNFDNESITMLIDNQLRIALFYDNEKVKRVVDELYKKKAVTDL